MSIPLLVTVLLAGVVRSADALPDLTPEVDDVRIVAGQTVSAGDVAEGCAAVRTDRTLVRFGVRFWNRGDEPLVVGAPGCPDCAENPGAVCADPRFLCSPADGHGHPHYDDFARYELLDASGAVVATGAKASFCIRETACATGPASGEFSCEEAQGIGVDCFDYYDASLGCQYVDVTGVPDVATRALRIRVTLDPDGRLPDADRTNNVTEFAIAGCGDGEVRRDEECDAGPTGGACCGADCRLRPAGAVCRAAAGPCDVAEECTGDAAACPADALAAAGTVCRPAAAACDAAEACDGATPPCPPDALAPDGTTCGPGAAPCVAAQCRAGACADVVVPGFCHVDAACVAAGARDASGCRTCDPAVRTDVWSDALTPDPPGLRCQLRRILEATDGCRGRAARRVGTAVAKLDVLIDRLAAEGRPSDRRKLERRTRALERLARRRGCAAREAGALRGQARAFLRLEAPGGP